jgi:transcriptional regulator with XRE-family HTH domain
LPKAKVSPIDKQLGAKLRMLREKAGISQPVLGNAIGISFQQIQKYEGGTNRISASKLYEIAGFLDIPITYFFDDLPQRGVPTKQRR